MGFTEIKLYKIKEVRYLKDKNQLEFSLLVPLRNRKFKLTFPYQSYEKAKILLYQFLKLNLTSKSEVSENDELTNMRISDI